MTVKTDLPSDRGTGLSACLLTSGDLRARCDPAELDFVDTSTLEPLHGLIGQDRALEAIRLSTRIGHADFNLYVIGPEGSGRHSAVQMLVETEAANPPVPLDWVYVNNFENPRRPSCLILRFDGVILSQDWKEATWDKFVTGAPRPRTPSEQQYSDRKLRSRS